MKVLWITNILFPDICKEIKQVPPVTGGWMQSSALALLKKDPSIKLAVAALYNGKSILAENIGDVTYYCLPFMNNPSSYNPKLESFWRHVKSDFDPDIVHIHGTEFSHGLAYIKACGAKNVVVSIQGLIGAYARYSLGGIPESELTRHHTVFDLLREHIKKMPERMSKQGNLESEYFHLVNDVIGRTSWDYNHTISLNPQIRYHFCNETLRNAFYGEDIWDYNSCRKFSIFLSQAAKPIKGLHILLKALPMVLCKYPNVKIFIAGPDLLAKKTLKEKLKYGAYAHYIQHLINKYSLQKQIIFLGNLKEEDMLKQYLSANIFVCPSSIENSPNSLGEAQILGVPCIASYVGGIPDMVENRTSGLLYPFDEYEMLACCIIQLFQDESLLLNISKRAREVALKRHSRENNAMQLISIYRSIM